MTTHEKALEASAKAIRSDIWEHEPNPTTERYVADLRQQAKDQAEAAVTAYLSALLPEDVAWLVERLSRRATTMNGASPVGAGDGNTYTLGYYDQFAAKDDREAASLIQSQAARERALEDALEHVTELLVDTWRVIMPASDDPEKEAAVIAARKLLNKEGRG